VTQVANYDQPCGFEDCPLATIGDHTLRQWFEHTGDAGVDLPYEEVPDRDFPVINGLEDAHIVDNVTARSAVAPMHSGRLTIKVPILLLDFSRGRPSGPPTPVVKVAFLSDPVVMRKVGKLLRDTANGAANAAERSH
jgi:hypothetical protein